MDGADYIAIANLVKINILNSIEKFSMIVGIKRNEQNIINNGG